MAIVIPNWDDRFETAQSRKVEAITWTPLRHSFAATLRMQPPEVAAAMLQIVLLAARMPTRGKLNDGGRDLTIDEVATYVGASSALVAKAMSALGADYRQKEGRKEGEEGSKDVSPRKEKRSSAGADARALLMQRVWNENRGQLPKCESLNKSRAERMAAIVREAKDDEVLLASTVAAFAADPFIRERRFDVDTLTRAAHRSKWLDKGGSWAKSSNGKRELPDWAKALPGGDPE